MFGKYDNKKHVTLYVTEETAKALKDLEGAEHETLLVKKVAKDLELSIEGELSNLDDDLARYKAACIVFKNSLKQVYEEQQGEIEEVINTQWDIMPKVKEETTKMMSQVKSELLPLQEQLSSVRKEVDYFKSTFNDTNWHGMQSVLDIIEKVNKMDDESKQMFKFLMESYKRQ